MRKWQSCERATHSAAYILAESSPSPAPERGRLIPREQQSCETPRGRTITHESAPKAAGSLGSRILSMAAAWLLLHAALCGQAHGQELSFAGVQSTLSTPQLTQPQGIAIDSSGNIFISDTAVNHVLRIDPSGNQNFEGTDLSRPAGIAVDSSGNLYIADTGNNLVRKVSQGGGQSNIGYGLTKPLGVAVDSMGNVIVADTGNNRVELVVLGGQGTLVSGLNQPSAVAVDAAENVYIADTGNGRVLKASLTANTPVTVIATGLQAPQGVAVDAAGNVFIADTWNNRVLEVPANGGKPFPVGGPFSHPTALSLDGSGNVYVVDTAHRRAVLVQTHAVNFGGATICPTGSISATMCVPPQLTLNYFAGTSATIAGISALTKGRPTETSGFQEPTA